MFCSYNSDSEDFCDGFEDNGGEEEKEKEKIETLFCGLNFRIPRWLNRLQSCGEKHEPSTSDVFHRRRG